LSSGCSLHHCLGPCFISCVLQSRFNRTPCILSACDVSLAKLLDQNALFFFFFCLGDYYISRARADPAFGAIRSRTRTFCGPPPGGLRHKQGPRGARLRGAPLPHSHNALVATSCSVCPPCRRAKWGSRSPPTTPRAYLCSVEGPSVPAGSQFLGVAPAPV
jgi:hypothetical protein